MKTKILVTIKTKCKNPHQIWNIVKKLKLEKFGFEIDKTYNPKPMPNNTIAICGFADKKEIEKIKKLPRIINIFNDPSLTS